MFFKKVLHISKKMHNFAILSNENAGFAIVREGLRGKPEGMLSGCGAVG